MTDNEATFLIAVGFVLGHATAWFGMWFYWHDQRVGRLGALLDRWTNFRMPRP